MPGGRLGLLETRRGEIIHAVLSHIDFVAGDIDSQLGESIRKTDEAFDRHFPASEIQRLLKVFLSNDGVGRFFAAKEGRTVLLEKEFANAAGQLYRMDRVVMDRDTVTVIDFKTGGSEMEEDYRVQVRNYMALLRDVFPGRRVSGAIAYVDRNDIKWVS